MASIQTWTWTGQCVTTCVGQAHLTVVLDASYVPGTLLFRVQGNPLQEALYQDSNVTTDLATRYGVTGISLQIPDEISLLGDTVQTKPDGTWLVGSESVGRCDPFSGHCSYTAQGVNGVWVDPVGVTVPEPATAVLVAVTFVVVIVGRGVWRAWRALRRQP